MKKTTRPEQEVFDDLTSLCRQPGYVHVLAVLCFQANFISYDRDEGVKKKDMLKIFSSDCIIKTESNTLLGLMIKSEVTWISPGLNAIQKYANETIRLLKELHCCMKEDARQGFTTERMKNRPRLLESGEMLREPIFYNGESAHHFQYRDLAVRRYAADASWMQNNKRFTMEQAASIVKAVREIQGSKGQNMEWMLKQCHNMLPLFTFTVEEVSKKVECGIDVVESVLSAFTLPSTERNSQFRVADDYNAITATPLLHMPTGEFVSLQPYAFAEAIYETPFYWMYEDTAYRSTHAKNRGEFAERFTAERLRLVFGDEHVYVGVDVFKTKKQKDSEIDVLVVWGDRVVIVQAKSKRMTVKSKKGNTGAIQDDFKKSVQNAYDQGVACAEGMLGTQCMLKTAEGREIALPQNIKKIYIFCVVSDHYPALNLQVLGLLQTQKIERVNAPLIMDVFAIDVLTEMLDSPLQFLSYVNRRSEYSGKLIARDEQTILGYYLEHNLWLEKDIDKVLLLDNCAAGLDIAMAVRRDGVPGPRTPDGILTRNKNTVIDRVINGIEAQLDPAIIDLGFFLLSINGKAINKMNETAEVMANLARADGKVHDASFAFTDERSGITFHCTDERKEDAIPWLEFHCRCRKYKHKANQWFGICISPNKLDFRFVTLLVYLWVQDSDMDDETKDMITSESFADI